MAEETKQAVPPELGQARDRFLALVAEVRPELHRYCARITGSVVDGEDVVQETLARAFYAISMASELPALRPWLFRVAHNTAVDFVRRYERRHVELRSEPPEPIGGEVGEVPADAEIVRAALTTFLALPVLQRSAVILKDVLGHSLEETAETIGISVPAVKSALSRGRTTLRARAGAVAEARPPARVAPQEKAKLEHYATLFNARDWGALRALLADECRLDLVAKAERRGKAVGQYYTQYEKAPPLRAEVGLVDGKPALLVFAGTSAQPAYFITIEWSGDRVSLIRDYRYVDYVAREIA
jgi:RNA polymerase sigma-70 factor (ECF subfamily)